VKLGKIVPYSMIRDAPDARENVEFIRIHQGTVTEVTPKGFDLVMRCILDLNKDQAEEIRRFLSHSASQ